MISITLIYISIQYVLYKSRSLCFLISFLNHCTKGSHLKGEKHIYILTTFTICAIESCHTITPVVIDQVCTRSVVLAWIWQAVIYICMYKYDLLYIVIVLCMSMIRNYSHANIIMIYIKYDYIHVFNVHNKLPTQNYVF